MTRHTASARRAARGMVRRHSVLLTSIFVGALVGSCCQPAPEPVTGVYSVAVERGRRAVTAGGLERYELYIPQLAPALPPPPWPAVVLTHGFARDRTRHRHNAQYLAERGIVVLVPDMASLLGGPRVRSQNIEDLVRNVAWLAERSATPGDPLYGLVDPARIGLAGHSAGGAVSFEAAIDSQRTSTPVAAVCLLDGVPWDRTLARAPEFPTLPLASWRSEPESCNAWGEIRLLLARVPFALEDVRIVGATHCDPENPSDTPCALACGCSTPERQELYQQFLYLFVRDTLRAPAVPSQPPDYATALAKAEARGQIVRKPSGTAAGAD